jgi:hypothetical protein
VFEAAAWKPEFYLVTTGFEPAAIEGWIRQFKGQNLADSLIASLQFKDKPDDPPAPQGPNKPQGPDKPKDTGGEEESMPKEGEKVKPSSEPKEDKTVIFLAGSIGITSIPAAVREPYLSAIIDHGYEVVVGDANGADKAFQEFLKEAGHKNVTVYYSGNRCRNNIGNWPGVPVPTPPSVTGRDFYAVKDKAMAEVANFGLFIWDGRSKGTLQDIRTMISMKKKVFVHVNGAVITLKSEEDLNNLLGGKESLP